MRFDVTSINTLYEYAIPSNGSFRAHIGYINYETPDGFTYKTLIMTKTEDLKIGTNVYRIKAGYIHINSFDKDYKKNFKNANIRDLSKWEGVKTTQKFMDDIKVQSENFRSENPPTKIAILGSSEIKGTYIHPLCFVNALLYVYPGFA